MNLTKFRNKLTDQDIIIEIVKDETLTLRLETKVKDVEIKTLQCAPKDIQLIINKNINEINIFFNTYKLSYLLDDTLELYYENEVICYLALKNDNWNDIFDDKDTVHIVCNPDLRKLLFDLLTNYNCIDCDFEYQDNCRISECIFIKASQAIRF